jgi:hypothetical protein
MTQLEDGIRRALRARASEVRPPLPPLDLRSAHARGRNPRVVYLRWASEQLRWLGPAAAVVAVLALVAGALLARADLASKPKTPAAAQIQTGGGEIETGVPHYYVALVNDGPVVPAAVPKAVATVRDTATGTVIASVAPPAPYSSFDNVTGATDDRTFVLLAVGSPHNPFPPSERFYLLRIHPNAKTAAGRASLTPLPANDISGGNQVQAMSLSPNGAKLAAILQNATAASNYLYVYNLVTGATRVWTRKTCGTCRATGIDVPAGDAPALSWTLDSKALAFTPVPASQLRLLDLSGPGDNVQPDSTVFPVRGVPVADWDYAVMAPNGRTVIVCYGETHGQSQLFFLARFSAVTGKLTGLSKGTAVDDVLWTSYNGSDAIVMNDWPSQSAGVYTGSHYTPLRWPRNVVDAAW